MPVQYCIQVRWVRLFPHAWCPTPTAPTLVKIYNGFAGFFDYGPLGVELKKNIKDAWWRDVVQVRDDIVGLDSSIIANPRVSC